MGPGLKRRNTPFLLLKLFHRLLLCLQNGSPGNRLAQEIFGLRISGWGERATAAPSAGTTARSG